MKGIYLTLVLLFCGAFTVIGQHNVRIMISLDPKAIIVNRGLDKGMTGISAINEVSYKNQIQSIDKLYTGKISHRNILLLQFGATTNTDILLEEYNALPEVANAEIDHTGSTAGVEGFTPNDANYPKQWGMNNDGTFANAFSIAGADVEMQKAWEIEQGDPNITVCILDSGVKLDHPEFQGRLWTNTKEIAGNGLDDDDNGLIDDFYGWDFVNSDNDPTDDLGHGTNVAGITAASGNNNIGYAGVDWNCKVMAIKGIDANSSGFYSWWISGIYYAVDNGANVINMSLGGNSNSAILKDAINYAVDKGVVVVVCMMNTNSQNTFYPAAFPAVIAVGSTDPDDTRTAPFFWSASSGSNYGTHISVVAPGNFIFGLHYKSNTNYTSYWGGTSQATPLVAGIASLLLAQKPSRTPAEIKSIIQSTSEDQVGDPLEDIEGWDKYYGYGRVNAFKALSQILSLKDPLAKNEQAFVYPNPAKETFKVDFPSGAEHVQIINFLGTIILEKHLSGQLSEEFIITQTGMYFIVISLGNHIITTKLLVTN